MKVRAKRVPINPEILMRMVEVDAAWRVSKGIPADSKLRGFTLDPYTQTLFLFVEHSSYPEVEVGDVLPLVDTLFQSIP